jgi:hypothetical protein
VLREQHGSRKRHRKRWNQWKPQFGVPLLYKKARERIVKEPCIAAMGTATAWIQPVSPRGWIPMYWDMSLRSSPEPLSNSAGTG